MQIAEELLQNSLWIILIEKVLCYLQNPFYYDIIMSMEDEEKVKFVIDKRTELVSIILALSKCNNYAEEHFNLEIEDDYRKDVTDYFIKFKSHPAILLAKELGEKEKGFNYDNPILLALNLQSDITFKGRLSQNILDELEHKDLLNRFLYQVEDFAKVSNFNKFYNKHIPYYQSKIKELSSFFKVKNFTQFLENYFKETIVNDFIVNIIPSLTNSNHGIKLDYEMWACVGLPSYDLKTINPFDNGYTHNILHEFMHSFVNENTLKCLKSGVKLNVDESLLGITKDYQNHISYFNDMVVRALTIRLREKLNGIDKDRFFEIEKRQGFSHVKEIYNELLDFEKQNVRWSEYFPNVIKAFKNNKDFLREDEKD